MPDAIYARSNPRIAIMYRTILKGNLKGLAKFLIEMFVHWLPIILPLILAAAEADAAGLTALAPGSPVPDGTDPLVRDAIEAARRVN